MNISPTILFLKENRQVTFDWHIARVIKWLQYDNNRFLDNILIYAAVDLRIAIERYILELLILLKYDGNNTDIFTSQEMRRIRSIKGIFAIMQETDPFYRKTARFTQLICEITPELPTISIIDTAYLRRKWEELSNYCHKQLDPSNTFESNNREFQKKGFALIREVVDKFWDWGRGRATGIISRSSMEKETLNIYNRFIRDEINEEQVRISLKIIEPVLKQRFRSR